MTNLQNIQNTETFETYKNVFVFVTFEKVFCRKLVKNVAGEAWDPSRKMRLEKLVRESVGIIEIGAKWCELWPFY